jgi:hypothetical protein
VRQQGLFYRCSGQGAAIPACVPAGKAECPGLAMRVFVFPVVPVDLSFIWLKLF